MIPSRTFGVARKLEPLIAFLPRVPQIRVQIILEFIGIDELLSRVVRRIDKDHFDLVGLAFLQEF